MIASLSLTPCHHIDISACVVQVQQEPCQLTGACMCMEQIAGLCQHTHQQQTGVSCKSCNRQLVSPRAEYSVNESECSVRHDDQQALVQLIVPDSEPDLPQTCKTACQQQALSPSSLQLVIPDSQPEFNFDQEMFM